MSENKKAHIVYPIHPGGGKFKDDTEFRYSLRSLEKHFKGDYDVTVSGNKLPKWVQGVKQLKHKQGLKSALVAAAAAYPDGFIWMYDDCCLLRDMDLADLMLTPTNKGIGNAQTMWSLDLIKIRDRLKEEGRPTLDYSRPHGPYWFDKAIIDEAFADWPGMSGKFPFETWILNKRAWPSRFGAVKQYYHAYRGAPAKGKWWFLNYNDNGNTKGLRDWLSLNFNEPSSFENGCVTKKVKMTSEERLIRLELQLGITDGGVNQITVNGDTDKPKNKVARVNLRPKGG